VLWLKTKIKTLFLVLVLILAFSNFSYALDDESSAETTDNLSQSTLNSRSTNDSNSYNSNNFIEIDNPSYNTSNSNNTTTSSSGSSGLGYIFQEYPGYSSMDLSILPSYYDLRDLGRVTPVKDQGHAGTCWIFSAVASLESCLLPNETWNFSENNIKNLLSKFYPQGYDVANNGGWTLWVLAYLARWSGPVNASDDPYNISNYVSPENLTVLKHLQDAIFVPPRNNPLDNNLLKEAIMNYGGVVSIMTFDDKYYNEAHSSFYSDKYSDVDHAICLVGWDDNYDKNNFQITPPGNGAFIVKNSWGTNWGEAGYFYISYYDAVLANLMPDNDYYPVNIVFNNAESTANYKQNYQYDPFGMIWYANSTFEGCSTAAFMNVFQANTSNPLAAASFYTLTPNTTYQLYAIVNNIQTLVSQGVMENAGYNTVRFSQLIPLIAGQQFKIMVNITSPGCLQPIAIEYASTKKYTSKATSSPGESFIFYDGVWTDLNDTIFNVYPQANLCLKAFTISASDLQIKLGTNNPKPVIGETVQFTINILNNGPDKAMDVKVNDLLPPGLDISSFSTLFGVYHPETGIWDIGELPVGQTASLMIFCTVKAAGELLNEAIISSSTYNSNPVNSTKIVIHSFDPANSAAGYPEVNAVTTKTTGMQNTGTGGIPLILATLLLIFGIFKNRRE
jgi:uncharacterized repeat protein (TIGR01451 family)